MLAGVLVLLGFVIVTRSVARSNLGALPVLGDYSLLLLFSSLVAIAIRHRRKPDVHKRLMLIATIGIAAPAIVRWPGAEAAVPISVVVPQLLLISAIMVHDKRTRGRVHHATGWGMAAYILALGVAIPLAASPIGHWVVSMLKQL